MGAQGKGCQDPPCTKSLLILCLQKFMDSFYRQFDLAMQLKKEELKKQGKMDMEVKEVS